LDYAALYRAMSDTVIRVEGIGKLYRVGERESYQALRDVLANAFRSARNGRRPKDSIWAVRDVSFSVQQGEVVGLIGRNGAGKSTLLKLLARITRPTVGFADIHGRIGSLLEVGTGFHPELTGRENIFLSGAILGMKKAEIRRKFDEIVAFAEVERFLDSSLKHYSSGMQMRLAFAVAAHLEPEILLVDEVLAVGDIQFQKKCLGKMQDVSRTGRTIIFVSHQMNQIRRLCQRVIWIDGGTIRQTGPASEIVNTYEAAMASLESQHTVRAGSRSPKARFAGWEIVEPEGSRHTLSCLGPVKVRFLLEVNQPIRHAVHGITLYTPDRRIVWGWAAYDFDLTPGTHELLYEFPMLPLKAGAYSWMISLSDRDGLIEMCDPAPEMHVTTESYQHPRDEWSGILNIPSRFAIHQRQEDDSDQASFSALNL
jgi:ABC-type polysaccharide/polyol phosphate transport system ATPase subunit